MSTSSVKFDVFNHIFNTFLFINYMINNKNQYNILNLEKEKEIESEIEIETYDDNDDDDSMFMLMSELSESNFCSDLSIGIISVGHIMILCAFCITSSFVFSFMFRYTIMVGRYVFNLVWNSFDKGHELPQLITIITAFTIYTYIMCSANSYDDKFNAHINKLEAEIAEKNYVIAELQTKVDQLLSEISDYDDTVWETVSESSSDDEDLQ